MNKSSISNSSSQGLTGWAGWNASDTKSFSSAFWKYNMNFENDWQCQISNVEWLFMRLWKFVKPQISEKTGSLDLSFGTENFLEILKCPDFLFQNIWKKSFTSPPPQNLWTVMSRQFFKVNCPYYWDLSGADPELLLGGGANPWGGRAPTKYFSHIFWKTLWN